MVFSQLRDTLCCIARSAVGQREVDKKGDRFARPANLENTMATAILNTLPRTAYAAHTASAAPARKGWLVRAYEAMAESQMHRARREVSRYLQTLPQDELNRLGYRTTIREDGQPTFIG
jgi:hypothetical protein